MTLQLHEELKALCSRFFLEEISDEGWALLQVHMAYCTGCRRKIDRNQRAPKRKRNQSPNSSSLCFSDRKRWKHGKRIYQ